MRKINYETALNYHEMNPVARIKAGISADPIRSLDGSLELQKDMIIEDIRKWYLHRAIASNFISKSMNGQAVFNIPKAA